MSVNYMWSAEEFGWIKGYQKSYRMGLISYNEAITFMGRDLGIRDRKTLEQIMDARY